MREVFVADTVTTSGKDWPHVSVFSVAPMIAASLRRLLVDVSTGVLA